MKRYNDFKQNTTIHSFIHSFIQLFSLVCWIGIQWIGSLLIKRIADRGVVKALQIFTVGVGQVHASLARILLAFDVSVELQPVVEETLEDVELKNDLVLAFFEKGKLLNDFVRRSPTRSCNFFSLPLIGFVENVDVIAQIQKMLFIHRNGPGILFVGKEIKDPLVVT